MLWIRKRMMSSKCLNRMNEDHTVETLKSPETAEALKKELGEKYSEKDLLDILEAVTELTEQGRLFNKDIYESLYRRCKAA